MNYHIGRLVLSSLCVGVFAAADIWLCSFCRLKQNLQNEHHLKPAAPELQHTKNSEQEDRCGNSSTQSQAPDDGYINV